MANIEDKNAFEPLINKQVKVIVNDLGKPHFIRGTLKKVTSNFIHIQGDFTLQVISISSIIKITANDYKEGI